MMKRGPAISALIAGASLVATLSAVVPIASASPATPNAPGGEVVGTGGQQARIVRSDYGVPSIYGATMQGLWFGAGWAQAEDRMAQLELTRRTVEGTLAALGGNGFLSQDEDVRNFYYTPQELRNQYHSLPRSFRRALQAFSDGINAYEAKAFASRAHERRMVPLEFFNLGNVLGMKGPYRPAPWRPTDTIAVGNYLARQFGGGGGSELSNLSFLRYLQSELTSAGDPNAPTDAMAIFNDARWINDPTAPTTVPPSKNKPSQATPAASTVEAGTSQSLNDLSWVTNQDLSQASSTLSNDRQQILKTGITLSVLAHGGSNAIAVAPWRSKSHHALLWGAPQEGFSTPSIDGEEYLHGPGYDAGGMDITGEPFILIGRNANVAWTTTSEELVDQRIYVEHVNFSTSPPTYLFDGKWVPLQVINEHIAVAGSSPVPYPVYRSADGPLFMIDKATGTAFSMRFASFGKETGTLLGFAQLGGDTTLAQFRHSMSLIATLHNFLYADRQGNIAYFGDGLVPIQPSFSRVDPRLPAIGDGTQQWKGFVPFNKMPHSINPAQGFLDNWNTKPSQNAYYQQNGGDEYWGTIFRSQRIAQMLSADRHVTIGYLEKIEHDIGQIDNGDNTRPAAPYFIPFVVKAYDSLVAAHDPLVDPTTHPDLKGAIQTLSSWNGHSTLGSPAMSIFMNFLEAFERNTFEGGTFPHEQYTGSVNLSDSSLNLGTFGGLGGYGTYNFLYHALAHTKGLVPCHTLCYGVDYFANHRDQLLVESVNDAITILSGTGTQLGQNVPGFGTADITKWGYRPAKDQNWNTTDPLAFGAKLSCGTSASQNRSTYMQAIELNHAVKGVNVLPPGQSGFINHTGVPSPHLCDQVKLFNRFHYKAMPPAQ